MSIAILKLRVGKGEDEFNQFLIAIGFVLNKDYFRQLVINNEDDSYYAPDFCFPQEKIIIEIDGKEHKSKKIAKSDEKRDNFFRKENYVVIRIPTEDVFVKEKLLFYKNLIKLLYEEREFLLENENYK